MTDDVFRSSLTLPRPLAMGWVMLGVPFVVEQMAVSGFDTVLIDCQHGLCSHTDMVNCLTAARAAGIPAVVRPMAADTGLIGRALDAGAQGVVCPLIDTAEDAEAVVRAVKYPPRGARSWGPYAARFVRKDDYFDNANGWTIASVQIETAAAMDNLDEILQVDGIDMALVGPNDLAAGLTGKRDIRDPQVVEAIELVRVKARENGVIAAIYANDIEYAMPLVESGWNVLTVGSDTGMLASGSEAVVSALRGGGVDT